MNEIQTRLLELYIPDTVNRDDLRLYGCAGFEHQQLVYLPSIKLKPAPCCQMDG